MKPKNKTGLPDNLKSGIENLSGISLDDVKVHYNSPKDLQLQAHAYSQGTDIHLTAGQEKHLPHEAWSVVQQKQGRVKPTIQMQDNVNVNDNVNHELKKEFDGMHQESNEIQYKQTKTAIQGQSNIYISNQLGLINVKHPFLLFGPLPTKGSYLIFGNSECLNKNIAEIKVQLYWEKDIPNDFTSYYTSYPQKFNNTSFKVAFSILIDGVWELLNDESFNLFEVNKYNTISLFSTFNLKLKNNFILAQSEKNRDMWDYDGKIRNGSIKMELIEPDYAFGHSVFSEVYSNAVRKNSSLPSLPYTPLVDEINFSIT